MMRAFSALALAAMLACDPSPGPPSPRPPAEPLHAASPNASIVPAPLDMPGEELPDAGTAPRDGGGRDAAADADAASADAAPPPPPTPLDPEVALVPDRAGSRDVAGLVLHARWRWPEPPAKPGGPHAAADHIAKLRDRTALATTVELAQSGRMRLVFESRGFPFARRTELLARADHQGHILLWPGRTKYRVIARGALRLALSELRADVTPLSNGVVTRLPAGRRAGYDTEGVELRGTLGRVRLELASIPEAGASGRLLCRTLVEICGIRPTSQVCAGDGVPLSAKYFWGKKDEAREGVAFEVGAVEKRDDLASDTLLAPPPRVAFVTSGLPRPAGDRHLGTADLVGLRSEATPAPPTDPKAPPPPESGLAAVNRSDRTMLLVVDGLPAALVRPWATLLLPELKNGSYALRWRTFLGEVADQSFEKQLPARVVYGTPEPTPDTPDAG